MATRLAPATADQAPAAAVDNAAGEGRGASASPTGPVGLRPEPHSRLGHVATVPSAGLVAALALALPELEGAKKNKANPTFKSKYADLGSVIDALEPLREHGLWFRQMPHENADGAMIETFYIHVSGEEKSAGTTFMPASKRDAQGFGSALTYCRRYGLQTAFGLATEDDDGNAASKRNVANDANGHAPDRINDAEWAMLVQLVESTGTDTAKLCQAYKAASLREFTPQQFTDAKRILEKRLADKAKEPSHA